ncbi:YkgJ family cysteine cluster protein [Vampirovibrio sp.]|uniref:YkgJ family cysteine cluster protein n=1 Tax=Vampirovibrio sp. TaxID=2717857 RepID=UPI003593A6D9
MSQDSNPAVYFNCQLCGECCSSWNIPIETHKAEQLLQKAWVQQRLASTRRALSPQSAEIYRIPLTDENVCVFLAPDKRCLIEVNEGLALKPHECKRFPFATVRMPDGTARHDTSAACKSISEKLLLAFQPILPKTTAHPSQPADDTAIQDSQAWLEDIGDFPARVQVSAFKTMDWQHYMAIRQTWQRWFEEDNLSAEQALAHVQASLNPSGHSVSPQLLKPKPWLNQLVTCCFLRKPYRTLSLLSLLTGGTYHDSRLFGEPVALRAQAQVFWHPDHERHLKAFLYNLLCRNRLLSAGGSAESLIAMAGIAALLVRWYAKALASLQGEGQTCQTDVATAIRLVERYYTGHQPRFFHFFMGRFKSGVLLKVLAASQTM